MTDMKLIVLANKNENNQGLPDFNNVIAQSAVKSFRVPSENDETVFSFSQPVFLQANAKYWFVFDVNYSLDSYFYNNRNKWQSALMSGDVYPAGEAGKAAFGGGNFQTLPNSDWYLKLGFIE